MRIRDWSKLVTPVAIERGGYMQRMWEQWTLPSPSSNLTKKQLVAQCSNNHKQQLQPHLETEETQHKCYVKGEPGCKVKGDISSSALEVGYQAPVTTSLYDTERLQPWLT